MSLQGSDSYAEVIDKACWSHSNGRSVFHISQNDVDSARLFCYAYRSLAVGTFHATRVAIELEEDRVTGPYVKTCLYQARVLLEQLETRAVDPIPRGPTCVISTLHYYDQWINHVVQILRKACARGPNRKLEEILHNFVRNVHPIIFGNGIYVVRDLELAEQSTFVVPNLNISIASLIYGDHHSWNAAFLSGDESGVSVHRHKKGAEIHLGFSPVKGLTILGACEAEVEEGYAMPIPPMTDHGFLNTSGQDHVLPFIFGSLVMGGWGLFFDVEPRTEEVRRGQQSLDSAGMNHSIFLERRIREMNTCANPQRQILISPERAGSAEVGGLELAVSRTGEGGVDLYSCYYRIVSVQQGKGRVRIGQVEREVEAHDHFGIPADLTCHLSPVGDRPLVFLDAMILPIK